MTKTIIPLIFALCLINHKYHFVNSENIHDEHGKDPNYQSCDCTSACDSESLNFKHELKSIQDDLDSCTSSFQSNVNATFDLNLCISNVTECRAGLSACQSHVSNIQGELESCDSKRDESETKILQECKSEIAALSDDANEYEAKINTFTSRIEILEKEKESLLTSEKILLSKQATNSKCKLDLVESEANYNEALQQMKNLEEKLAALEERYDRKLKSLKDDKTSLISETERQKRQLKQYREKELDLKHKTSDLESQLWKMHRAAQSTYLNVTLVVEDVTSFVSRGCEKVVASDQFHAAAETLSPVYNSVMKSLNVMKKWHKENLLQGSSQAMEKLVTAVPKMQKPVEYVILAVESTRLSLVSLLKQTSKVALNYLQLRRKENDTEHVMQKYIEYFYLNADDIVQWMFFVFSVLVLVRMIIKPFLRIRLR